MTRLVGCVSLILGLIWTWEIGWGDQLYLASLVASILLLMVLVGVLADVLLAYFLNCVLAPALVLSASFYRPVVGDDLTLFACWESMGVIALLLSFSKSIFEGSSLDHHHADEID